MDLGFLKDSSSIASISNSGGVDPSRGMHSLSVLTEYVIS